MKFLKVAVLFFGLAAAFAVRAQGGTYPVSGRVIDRLSRRPVAYAAVVLAGQEFRRSATRKNPARRALLCYRNITE